MEWILVALGALVIVGLSIYAGRLLFLLQTQNKRQQAARQKRIDSITSSIQTIAFAMQQQQCDLSEGVIRICRLLEALPLDPLPNYADEYPAVHGLFGKVKHYPTHEERNSLPKAERRAQDKEREQFESEAESAILKETEALKVFNAP
ncbi:DUF2489 domain-containing protein [Glaciecola siphonariae]|uniref:DUF2489 domain-containing protein n=1 Tax=Glaciecola siphonariae TaxID=521012 RepID=A0ABV9LQL8_9ALTE